MKPLYYRSVSSKGAGRPRLTHHHNGWWNGTKWMRWVWRNGGMKFVVGENGRNPAKNLPRPRFAYHETHMEGPRRELRTPAVVLHAYIKYKYSNYYLHSKITRRPIFFANQSINSWLSVASWGSLFNWYTKPVLTAVLEPSNSSKNVSTRSKHEKHLPTEVLCK